MRAYTPLLYTSLVLIPAATLCMLVSLYYLCIWSWNRYQRRRQNPHLTLVALYVITIVSNVVAFCHSLYQEDEKLYVSWTLLSLTQLIMYFLVSVDVLHYTGLLIPYFNERVIYRLRIFGLAFALFAALGRDISNLRHSHSPCGAIRYVFRNWLDYECNVKLN